MVIINADSHFSYIFSGSLSTLIHTLATSIRDRYLAPLDPSTARCSGIWFRTIAFTTSSTKIVPLARAKRSKRFEKKVYKPGDFVRLKIYKPKPRHPKYTYKDGPLRLMTGTWNADTKKYRGPYEADYEGVYMVHKVSKSNEGNKIARAPTYTIIGQWSKCRGCQWGS